MNSEKNILDNFLQQKVEESTFAFDEAHWQKALSRLENEDDNKKPIFPWWKLSILLVLLAGSIFSVKYWANKHTQKQLTSKNNTTDSNSNLNSTNSSNAVLNNPSNTTSTKNVNNTSKNENNLPATMPTNKHTVPNMQMENTPNVAAKNKTIFKVENEKTQTNQNNKDIIASAKNDVAAKVKNPVQEPTFPTRQNVQTHKKISLNTNQKIVEKNIEKKETAIQNSYKKSTNNKVTNSINPTNETMPIADKKIISKIKKSKKSKKKIVEKELEIQHSQELANNPVNKNSKIVQQKLYKETNVVVEKVVEKRRMSEEEMIRYNPRYVKDLHAFVYHKVDTTFQIYNPINTTSTPDVKKNSEPIKHHLSYFTTAQLALNKSLLGNANASQQWKPTPYLGFGALLPLTSKLTISSLLALTYFSGLNMQTSSYHIAYGFGRDSTNTLYKDIKQWQIQLPIAMQYAFGKSYVQAGVGINYGFAVQDKITDNTGKSTNSFAYKNGIKAFDYFLHIGYGLQIDKNFVLSVILQQGLKDISKNAYYKNTITDREARCNVGVIYKLNRK